MPTLKTGFMVLLIYLNMLVWPEAHASETDYMGIPVDNHILWGVASAGIIADWGTTLDIAERHDEGYEEANTRIGTHPSRGDVNRYFIFKLAVYAGVNLWPPLRKVKNFLNIHQSYVSWDAVNKNVSAGLNVNF